VNSINVVFRADASLEIGTGHIKRCLTLATALKERGAECQFISREHTYNLLPMIRNQGFEVVTLPLPVERSSESIPSEDALLAHANWLGVSQEEDARQCVDILGDTQPDWLVVDHYSLDVKWQSILTSRCRKLMVIDDLADRFHICDLLLDQNWFAEETDTRYDSIIPEKCTRLLGPQFSLLGAEYARASLVTSQRDGNVRRILVFLGGSDSSNQTAKVTHALMLPKFANLTIDVVIGVNHPNSDDIKKLIELRPNVSLYCDLPSLADLMARADLMISGGGATSWERMALGLPAIVISIAENQTATNQAMMDAGYINFIGEKERVTVGKIAGAVSQCLANPQELREMSRNMRKLVPVNGTVNVCKQMLNS
jgi:UDP-2,4-diacetamido-2,4,6-trideoxy-beta-L-altropyranose hydrolase